jgi:hypothetical protein
MRMVSSTDDGQEAEELNFMHEAMITEPEKSMTGGEMHDGPVNYREAPKGKACFTAG